MTAGGGTRGLGSVGYAPADRPLPGAPRFGDCFECGRNTPGRPDHAGRHLCHWCAHEQGERWVNPANVDPEEDPRDCP